MVQLNGFKRWERRHGPQSDDSEAEGAGLRISPVDNPDASGALTIDDIRQLMEDMERAEAAIERTNRRSQVGMSYGAGPRPMHDLSRADELRQDLEQELSYIESERQASVREFVGRYRSLTYCLDERRYYWVDRDGDICSSAQSPLEGSILSGDERNGFTTFASSRPRWVREALDQEERRVSRVRVVRQSGSRGGESPAF